MKVKRVEKIAADPGDAGQFLGLSVIGDGFVEFPRGSRKAPKLLISGERGKLLLKRRARGRDEPQKVAFTHCLQFCARSVANECVAGSNVKIDVR